MIRLCAAAMVCAISCASVQATEVDYTPQPPAILEKQWKKLHPPKPRTSVREFFSFALEATAADWGADKVEAILGLAEQAQDRDESSVTFGNFKWYFGDEKPIDRNAVEFSMQKAALILILFRDRLTPKARESLDRLTAFSVEGIRRHNVREAYTNIFLMKVWNCIALGEATGRDDLADEGYWLLDRWLMHTWESGVHEYLSPTYYAVDLDSLGLLARFAKRDDRRKEVETIVHYFWFDIAANWFEPCQRIGGAHSRDYDYLTGHGNIKRYAMIEGWIPGKETLGPSAFRDLSMSSSRGVRDNPALRKPRLVCQRWGLAPYETAVHWIGKRLSVGSAGANYGPMDKPLSVNIAGNSKTPNMIFFMDARGDAYGKQKFGMTSGHTKALHLEPFLTSVQRGPEVLLLASIAPDAPKFDRDAPEPTCLMSHLVAPADGELWVGEGMEEPFPLDGTIGLAGGEPIFLKFGDVAVGMRVALAVDTAGGEAMTEISTDGKEWGAMRMSVVHSKKAPEGRGTAAVWIRAAEGLTDESFQEFRVAFCNADLGVEREGGRVSITAGGLVAPLRLVADVEAGRRLEIEGGEPSLKGALLCVNGRDLGREMLGDLGPIKQYRTMLEAAEQGVKNAPSADTIIEAENAALLIVPFRVDEDKTASGGKFIWGPGVPEIKGTASGARLLLPVHVPSDGDYRLWARLKTPTSADDSFYIAVRQADSIVVPNIDWHTGVYKEWTWTPVKPATTLRLSKGVALIEIRGREDGAQLDAVYLSSDLDDKPPAK